MNNIDKKGVLLVIAGLALTYINPFCGAYLLGIGISVYGAIRIIKNY